MKGTLFVVSTPIGNLGDMTLRAIETLKAVDGVVAEDTRRTRGLLSHLGIAGKPLLSLHAHSLEEDVARIAARVETGDSLAMVTDAGTPAVSDPGEALVRAVIEGGGRVVPIPGASAVLAALVASGLSADGRFRFMGFLPRDRSARRDAIVTACGTPEPVVLFEAANRTAETLKELAAATPERPACVARELTKVHEELVRGRLDALANPEREWLGEVVVVLGAHAPDDRTARIDDGSLDARIDEELRAGGHAKGIAERLAAWSGRPKREVYGRVLARKV